MLHHVPLLLRASLLLLLVLLGRTAHAQDVIIKTNKEEVKARVTEVQDEVVKYKRFDEPDGPTYSIRKDEVFVILYKSGRRETFDAAPAGRVAAPAGRVAAPPAYTQPAGNASTLRGEALRATLQPPAPEKPEPDPNALDYEPIRLMVYSYNTDDITGAVSGGGADASAFSIQLTAENRLLGNFLNWGVVGSYTSIKSSYDTQYASAKTEGTTAGVGIYTSLYLPVNRLLGAQERQNRGFFPYLHLGGMYSRTDYTTKSSSPGSPSVSVDDSYSGFGTYYAFGLDYRFSTHFGLSLQTAGFSAIGGGINFGF